MVSNVEPVNHDEKDSSRIQPGRRSKSLRFKFFLTGVLFPAIAVLFVLEGTRATIASPWQSGLARDHVAMLLEWPAIGVFLPLVIFHMTCLTLWLVKPDWGKSFVVRLGITTGVLLALQFLIFVVMTSSYLTLVTALFVGPGLWLIVFAFRYLVLRARKFSIRHLLILTTIAAVISLLLSFVGSQGVLEFLAACALYVMGATPTLNLITYVRSAIAVNRETSAERPPSNVRIAIGVFSFLAVWATSWKFAVDIMLAEYAKLPTTNPNCYVSSAAAHGHRHFVGATHFASGHPSNESAVNMQMRRLKFLELAMAAACPQLHRIVRRIYDRIGPKLAHVCRSNEWFADATYILLLPLEGAAELVRIRARIPIAKVNALYRSGLDSGNKK